MNKWVVITGASRGLGEYLVKEFWRTGWSVALVARDKIALNQVVSELKGGGSQEAAIFTCDLGDPAQVDRLVVQLSTQLPSLNALINNAAIHGPIGPLDGCDIKHWNESIQVNLLSPVALCHGLIKFISNSGGGSIINLSGGGAAGPRENFTAYASAKTALVRFSETLAQEVSASKIQVNCIAPGVMKTALLKEVLISGINSVGAREFNIAEKVFLQDEKLMEKVSQLALFLVCEASQGISGKLISAVWDRWQEWPKYIEKIQDSDAYTLRRITGRERGMDWGDV